MYFIFKSDPQEWKGKILHAELQDDVPDFDPDWRDCLPIEPHLPKLTYLVDSKAPLLDNYYAEGGFDLYSVKLIELLRHSGVNFETFDVFLQNKNNKKNLQVTHQIFHLLEIYPALDLEQSDLGPAYPLGKALPQTPEDMDMDPFERYAIRKIVLNKRCLELKPLLFRPEEIPTLVFIHQDLKKLLETEQITGCEYIPIEDYCL